MIRMVESWHSQTRRQLQRKRGIEAITAETTNSLNLTCTLRLMKRVFFFSFITGNLEKEDNEKREQYLF